MTRFSKESEEAGWSRRAVLGWGLAGAASWAALPTLTSCGGSSRSARNVIFLVADGMSLGVPSLAEPFSQLVRHRGTHWHALLRDPQAAHGFFDMASQNSLVTDSAAAASAWGSGRRVPNGLVNHYADGTALTPLVPLVQATGRATGLVTTARVTHATPAGFCANARHRDYEDQIAVDYAERRPEVLLGGGSYHFDPLMREDGRDLAAEFRGGGYTLAGNRAELAAAHGADRLLGLFAIDHLPYTLDQKHDPALAGVPDLAAMTEAALAVLSRNRRGFFLLVEGARIDHAAHANDAAGIVWDQLAFDDALGVALEFQKHHPDTLVVVGSDHGNANPGLNGMGPGYRESTGCFQRLARATATAPRMRHLLAEKGRKKAPTRQEVREVLQRGTGFVASDAECGILLDALAQKPLAEASGQQANFFGQLGQILGNWNGIGWTGVTHTADWTPLSALGPGQEAFAGLMKNTDFFDRVTDLWGIRHRNPEDKAPQEPAPPEERASADPTG